MDSGFGYELIMAKLVEMQSKYFLQLSVESVVPKIMENMLLFSQQTFHKQILDKFRQQTSTLEDLPITRKVEQQPCREELKEEISTLQVQLKSMKVSLEQLQEQISKLGEYQFDVNKALLPIAYKWVPWVSDTEIPDHAVIACRIPEVYVGRVRHNGDDIVGQAAPSHKFFYIAYSGNTLSLHECEVLTGSGFSWVNYSGGALPANAFPAGRKANGDVQYIGRVDHRCKRDNLYYTRPGSVDGKTKILTIAFWHDNFDYEQFEVLVKGD